MNILSDTYIFYADVYFLQNVVIKIAVLYFSLYCNKCYSIISLKKGMMKIVAVACMGTFSEMMGLRFVNSYYLFLVVVHVFEIPFMIRFVLGKAHKQMFQMMICSYFFVMVINAVLEVFWNWFGEYGNYAFWLCVSCAVVYIGLRIFQNTYRMQKGIFMVEIFHQGKKVSSYGFYDSGNRLMDPYTQKGVHIVSENLYQRLGGKKESPVLVPYQALGNEMGMIEVFYVEELRIEGEKQSIQLQKCPMGVTKDNLFEGKKYEIILNEEVF